MAEFIKTTANQSQIEAANSSIFGNAPMLLPPNMELVIKKADYIAFTSNGKESKAATPVILYSNTEEVTYIRALVKQRFNYQMQTQEITGTLNKWFVSRMGKTLGEVMDDFNKKFAGKKLKTIVKSYYMIDKTGEVRPVSYNEFDIVE